MYVAASLIPRQCIHEFERFKKQSQKVRLHRLSSHTYRVRELAAAAVD